MRAYLCDPAMKTVTEIDFDDSDNTMICELLGQPVENIECLRMNDDPIDDESFNDELEYYSLFFAKPAGVDFEKDVHWIFGKFGGRAAWDVDIFGKMLLCGSKGEAAGAPLHSSTMTLEQAKQYCDWRDNLVSTPNASDKVRAARPWGKGRIIVTANGAECFDWTGTHGEAVALQRRYLDTLNVTPIPAQAFADRAVFSLIANGGPPQVGQDDLTSDDVEALRNAVLWVILREHIPDTGFKIEDALANTTLEAQFTGDRDLILRAIRGEHVEPEFELQVIPRGRFFLDPREAVSISGIDLFNLVDPGGRTIPGGPPFHAPRVPLDAAEGREMLRGTATCEGPEGSLLFYVGFTREEISRVGLRILKMGMLVKKETHAEKRPS